MIHLANLPDNRRRNLLVSLQSSQHRNLPNNRLFNHLVIPLSLVSNLLLNQVDNLLVNL